MQLNDLYIVVINYYPGVENKETKSNDSVNCTKMSSRLLWIVLASSK